MTTTTTTAAKIVVQQWVAAKRGGQWKTVGTATTWRGVLRIAQRVGGPEDFGGHRHPEGGPKYGTIRAVQGDEVSDIMEIRIAAEAERLGSVVR